MLKNSKLQELMTAQKMIDDDIQMLRNDKPQKGFRFKLKISSAVWKNFVFIQCLWNW